MKRSPWKSRVCDHTSVGILAFDQEGRLLLIDRKKGAPGLAPPAGHVDDHGTPEDAARAELFEEVGLTAISLRLLKEGRKENPCRREGGSWHYWRVYSAHARGEIRVSLDETKGHYWITSEECERLVKADTLTVADGERGLEPVWREWLDELCPMIFNQSTSNDQSAGGGKLGAL